MHIPRRLVVTASQPFRSISCSAVVDAGSDVRQEFRHSLRRLLREASYLPDVVARDYFHSRIIASFRKHGRVLKVLPSSGSQPQVKTAETAELRAMEKIGKLRDKVRETQVLLAKANRGSRVAVSEVLGLAYGRTGPQRQRLLGPYLRPDEAKDSAELEKLAAAPIVGSPEDGDASIKALRLPSAIRALAAAQIAQGWRLDKVNVLQSINVVIPKKNLWGRPTPIKRVRNLKKKAYRRLIKRLLPPIPREQWERLKRLITGEERWRRPRQPTTMPTQDMRGSLSGTRHHQQRYYRKLSKNSSITERFMLRRYRELFPQCAMIQRSPGGDNTWIVQYGWTTQVKVPKASVALLASYGINASLPTNEATQG